MPGRFLGRHGHVSQQGPRSSYASAAETREGMLGNDQLPQLRGVYERTQRFIDTMQDAGITVGVGSDSGAGRVEDVAPGG